ncbi:MAG: molybdenum cofactor biosynthesis protein MoaE [Actinomycetota bacterium]|nr:molybdenum cofactor biosynthesis protein MoaE [Actinomycetota bacterium]
MSLPGKVTAVITTEVIDPSRASPQISPGVSDGALVTFGGYVRDSTDSRQVSGLEYEAYDEMAVAQMREIGEQARTRWDVSDIWLVHRTGSLSPGECSVIVAVAAPHRGPAFDACEFCIDTLKEQVSIWKKELFVDGEASWVNHP